MNWIGISQLEFLLHQVNNYIKELEDTSCDHIEYIIFYSIGVLMETGIGWKWKGWVKGNMRQILWGYLKHEWKGLKQFSPSVLMAGVLASFVSDWHTHQSLGKRNPRMRKSYHWIALWECSWTSLVDGLKRRRIELNTMLHIVLALYMHSKRLSKCWAKAVCLLTLVQTQWNTALTCQDLAVVFSPEFICGKFGPKYDSTKVLGPFRSTV